MSPLNNSIGKKWQDVNKELNNIMEEFIKYVAGFNPPGSLDKISKSGLTNCVEQLTKLRGVSMHAADSHELVRCNEVMNLIEIGLAMVLAALDERQYQRGIWFLGMRRNDEMFFNPKPITAKYPPKEAK